MPSTVGAPSLSSTSGQWDGKKPDLFQTGASNAPSNPHVVSYTIFFFMKLEMGKGY